MLLVALNSRWAAVFQPIPSSYLHLSCSTARMMKCQRRMRKGSAAKMQQSHQIRVSIIEKQLK